MATYTSNINLKKPAQSDKIRIADFNTNADNIDDAFGAGFGQSSAPSVNAEINSLADGLAIIANGNVHAAISSGQFVYVRGHGTLANGLYVANQNISANATLTSSNLDADSSGGLNALSARITPIENAFSKPSNTVLTIDLNNDLNSGFYRISASSTNIPVASTAGILIQVRFDSSVVMQIFMTSGDIMYSRIKYAGWGAWRQCSNA